MRIAIAVVILVVGCRYDNPSGTGDSPQPCTKSDPSCVCLASQGVCVECTVDDERNCTPDKPQCGDDNRCRQCRANSECASDACLDTGACADASKVIYASPSGANTAGCGQAKGQSECSIGQAVSEITAGGRNVIRLAPGTYTVPSGTIDGLDFSAKSGTLIARGATLTRGTPNGAIISVRNGQTLTLVGGTVQGPNNTTDGIKCVDNNSKLLVHEATIEGMTQSGIETNTCQLTVARSTLRDNKLGGINMTVASTATITNNFVYRNGGPASPIGGLGLKLTAGSKLEFNTVVDNNADPSNGAAAGGIACDAPSYDAPYNLVYLNVGGLGGQVQVIGTCTFINSYKQSAMPAENAVGFENPTGATPSYRLTAGSPAEVRDAFDCRDLDFERDVRPFPAGGKCDMGADEFRTP